jgi:hypothetical protein
MMSIFDILGKLGSLPMDGLEKTMTEFPQVMQNLSAFLGSINGRMAATQDQIRRVEEKLDRLLAIADQQIPPEILLENMEASRDDEDPRQRFYRSDMQNYVEGRRMDTQEDLDAKIAADAKKRNDELNCAMTGAIARTIERHQAEYAPYENQLGEPQLIQSVSAQMTIPNSAMDASRPLQFAAEQRKR